VPAATSPEIGPAIPACVIKVMTKPIRNEEASAPHRS